MLYTNKNEYLEYLIENYSDTVYRLAMSRTRRKENSEDVFQEVFLRLSKKIPQFESKEHEKAWIIRVTINCSNNILESKWSKIVQMDDEEIPFETKERHDIYYAVLSLPLKYRTMIYLFYYEGYKTNEISKILKIKENTVKSQLLRAREQLKVKMKGGDLEDE